MGLFSKKPQKDSLIAWLEKADDEYQKAFQSKDVSRLEPFFTRPCLSKLVENIRMSDKAYQGLVRYQHIQWAKGECSVEMAVYHKQVTYDQIKMSHGIVVPVGDEYSEDWTIIKENGVNKISSVRRLANE